MIIITISRVYFIFSDGNSERKGLNLISKEHKEQCCHTKGKAEDEHNGIEGEVETLSSDFPFNPVQLICNLKIMQWQTLICI